MTDGPPRAGIADLEADAEGRLYASTSDPAVTFIRWTPSLDEAQVFGPRYRRIEVEFPGEPVGAGGTFVVKVRAS